MTSDVVKTHLYNNDEIDVLQLFRVLWQGKVLICIFALIFTTAGVFYALKAQQWWTSTAVITSGQYQNKIKLREELFSFINAVELNSKTDETTLNKLINSNQLFDDFVAKFNAYNNKVAFFESNPIMLRYAKGLQTDASISGQFFELWSGKVIAELANKQNNHVYILKFQGKTASDSHELLKAYIDFTNQQVKKDILSSLNAKYSLMRKKLIAKLDVLNSYAKQKISIETQKTKYALDIAEAAQVERPLTQMGNNNLFSIELGISGLKEQEKILENTKDLSLFEPAIRMVSFQLNQLDKANIPNDINLKLVKYLQSPNFPNVRNEPNRVRIVIIAIFLGFLIGCAVVLLRNICKKLIN